MLKQLTVRGIMEKAMKITNDEAVKKEAGKVIKNTEIEMYREIVAQSCLKYGATHKKTVKLSEKLDELVVAAQKRRLEAC
ncbi:aspartyl-phosphate phosphatase Spo0E family protein [Tepidibacter mesophilus]|uniref:aspartyl-phosphate phosphatase Spo0E family protein n=1 Tax=Tepidibacter mesophilus TaxID=655607 RepID=UPI000C06D429|nr:aspartyl-phosphate phosphatase Spo0E family protein [Tepidibacter mesophilus]